MSYCNHMLCAITLYLMYFNVLCRTNSYTANEIPLAFIHFQAHDFTKLKSFQQSRSTPKFSAYFVCSRLDKYHYYFLSVKQ